MSALGVAVSLTRGYSPVFFFCLLIFCVALLPYFVFKELERAVGAGMFAKLLLGVR